MHISIVDTSPPIYNNTIVYLCLDSDWIVVNRGLYVCDECCSIHRSLGRHISQIKSLSADWCPTTLNVSTS